jgi:hypothetical protein
MNSIRHRLAVELDTATETPKVKINLVIGAMGIITEEIAAEGADISEDKAMQLIVHHLMHLVGLPCCFGDDEEAHPMLHLECLRLAKRSKVQTMEDFNKAMYALKQRAAETIVAPKHEPEVTEKKK